MKITTTRTFRSNFLLVLVAWMVASTPILLEATCQANVACSGCTISNCTALERELEQSYGSPSASQFCTESSAQYTFADSCTDEMMDQVDGICASQSCSTILTECFGDTCVIVNPDPTESPTPSPSPSPDPNYTPTPSLALCRAYVRCTFCTINDCASFTSDMKVAVSNAKYGYSAEVTCDQSAGTVTWFSDCVSESSPTNRAVVVCPQYNCEYAGASCSGNTQVCAADVAPPTPTPAPTQVPPPPSNSDCFHKDTQVTYKGTQWSLQDLIEGRVPECAVPHTRWTDGVVVRARCPAAEGRHEEVQLTVTKSHLVATQHGYQEASSLVPGKTTVYYQATPNQQSCLVTSVQPTMKKDVYFGLNCLDSQVIADGFHVSAFGNYHIIPAWFMWSVGNLIGIKHASRIGDLIATKVYQMGHWFQSSQVVSRTPWYALPQVFVK